MHVDSENVVALFNGKRVGKHFYTDKKTVYIILSNKQSDVLYSLNYGSIIRCGVDVLSIPLMPSDLAFLRDDTPFVFKHKIIKSP